MSILQEGCSRIAKVVNDIKSKYSGKKIIFIKHLRNFGDVMHSTVVVQHYRKVNPDSVIIWAISEKYVKEFETFSKDRGPDVILGLPHGPPFPDDGPIRKGWYDFAQTLGIKVVIGSVHPFGWSRGSIVDAILDNAKITKLSVDRLPYIPLDISDYVWHDDFCRNYDVRQPFVTVEYQSYSLGANSKEWYIELVRNIKCQVVALGGRDSYLLDGAIDSRGCTFRQAKVHIQRSKCFIGCASGNGMLSVSDGVETPIVELATEEICYGRLGYIRDGRRYVRIEPNSNPLIVAEQVNRIISR